MRILLTVAAALLATVTVAVPNPEPKNKFIDKRPPATTSAPDKGLKPWPRTVAGKFELVTPTVVDGITFSASPKPTYKTPPPWVSLNKEGRPKTIKPQIKGGDTKNPWPDYDTYFDTPKTVTHDLTELIEGHDGDRYYHEVQYIPEDKTDEYLNPLIRCTPDRYFNKNHGKKNSDPFCTPVQDSHILLDTIHWVTWYTRHFDQNEQVRIHMAYIEEKLHRREAEAEADAQKASKEGSTGFPAGAIDFAFWSSPYMENTGFLPLEIDEAWLDGQYEQLVVMALQPESMDNNAFSFQNATHLKIRRGPTVTKKKKEDRAKIMTTGDDGLIMAVIALPTCLVIVGCGYLLFVYATRNARSIPHRKARSKRRFGGANYENLATSAKEV